MVEVGGGTGAVATTVNVTGTLTEEVPMALSVILPLYVPTVEAPATVTVTTLLSVPEIRSSVSQGASSLADQVKVPPPWLLIFKVWGAGLAPAVAVKERLVGLIPMAGGTGAVATMSVTGTLTEEAPEAFIVTAPL